MHWLGAQVSFHSHKRPLPLRVSKNAFGRIPPLLYQDYSADCTQKERERERERELHFFGYLYSSA